ncbi:CpsD/CapB family tyrosine-protein kinase [Comamonas flocculans]|uniref:CpsD/CapB family tyrosine-protein kinase n=1 Tax=Comamonas flocculans TaxID=2597701 RepID=A0A5B8RW94_9BURK|nr:CpsD/CapB family tyrosine-protein kinase [Comamonas flocculans]QEA12495.1 CpsD/CapB family tyrosine-protein kinase [Comamonas flocculans]
MERIKQALEKARAQAGSNTQHVQPGPRRAAPATLQPAAPPLGDGGIDVNYTQTQVVTLDPVHLERQRIVAFSKTNPNNWAFDVLRTQILQKMDEKGWRTLAITSPTAESGKTVIAINLAISVAHHTQRTAMLVDFDLRRPRVGSYLGVRKTPSLNEVLAGTAPVAEALINPDLPRLVVLPTNEPVQRAAEVLTSAPVASLVSDLRERYQDRTVIFDLPPMMAGDDVMAILPRMDAVLMVVGNGNSTQREIEESMRHIPAGQLLGVVLNKADAEVRRGYEYGYGNA